MRDYYWHHFHHYNGSDNSSVYIPIWIALCVFVGNIVLTEIYRVRNIRREINNSIFEACENIMRLSFQSNHYLIEHRKCHALSKITESDEKEENEKYAYFFYVESDKCRYNLSMAKIQLIKHMQDYNNINGKDKALEINELLLMNGPSHINSWNTNSVKNNTKEEIEKVCKENKDNVISYIETESIGQYIREIQKIVHPDYPYDKINPVKDK